MSVFKLSTETIELHQLLKAAGLCASGGEAKQMIEQGLVEVDGAPELRKGRKLQAGQTVMFQGQEILLQKNLPG